MTIVYRTTGAWGAGQGSDLSASQIDGNFHDLASRMVTQEARPDPTTALAALSDVDVSEGAAIDGYVLSWNNSTGKWEAKTVPAATLRSRGLWAAATAYSVNDTFYINGTVYLVRWPHVSDTSFDPGANDGAGHDYYGEMVPAPGNALPTGGAVGMALKKSTIADYATTFGWVAAVEVTFAPSTASSLTSDNVADALEELEALIGDLTVDALQVTFAAPTGSALTSTNVADALVELEGELADYLPLSGGTMTGAITLAADASSAMQPVTKQQLDGIALNLGKRGRVRAATTANITIATALNNGDALDGVTLATNDLVLVRNQSSAAENGVYVVGASPTRFSEFDTYDKHPGALLAVEEGTANADTIWLCTSNAGGTLNTTAINFNQTSATGALLAANNFSDLANPSVARGNLGLGSIATFPEATAAQYLADTAGKALSVDKVWSAADLVPLTDGGTIALDMSAFINAEVTLGGNRTLGNPSNTKNGQAGVIKIAQDGTGSRTLAFASNWKFAGGAAPALTTAAAAVDLLFYQVISPTFIYGTLIKDAR